MKVKKFLSGLLCITLLTSTLFTNFGMKVYAAGEALGAAPQYVGNVLMSGDKTFDSNSIVNADTTQWRWLSYPESRIVENPGNNRPKYDGGMSLNLGIFVKGIQKLTSIQKMQMGATSSGAANDASSISTAWYPYKLTAHAVYGTSTVDMSEFFADKNTFVRMMDVGGAANQTMTMSAAVSNQTINADGSMLVHGNGYYLLYKVLSLNNDGTVNSIIAPTVSNGVWTAKIPFTGSTGKVAFTLTIATEADGDQAAIDRSKAVSDGNLVTALTATKAFWDGKLSRIPMPTQWGIKGGLDPNGVTPDQHRRSFYAAWTFLYQNIIEPTPETGYNYYQVTLGKASLWPNGDPVAPNSCSWESMFEIEELASLEPDIAWSAAEGFIESIQPDGSLAGECLPSQKAHMVWTIYQNKPDDVKLANLYAKIRSYLLWRYENPRWMYIGHHFSDEKDISFVSQWYSDVDYAIKMCKILGKSDDIAMWEYKKEAMDENVRQWFFTPAPGDPADKIYNSYFTDLKTHYAHDRLSDVENYINSILFADLPADLNGRIVDHYVKLHDITKDLVGFDFYKYGDGNMIAYGLLEKRQAYPQLANKFEEYVNAALRSVIRTVEFTECARPDNTKGEGVTPSSFAASTLIDFTYLNNGARMDSGIFSAIGAGDTGIQLADTTPLQIYTINGEKPELPKYVMARDKNSASVQALVLWDKVTASQYAAAGSFVVNGVLAADSTIKVTANVNVYGGNVNIAPIAVKTIQNRIPLLPQYVTVSCSPAQGTSQSYMVSVTWNNMENSDFTLIGQKTVKGKINFNGQEISAGVEVSGTPYILSQTGTFEVDQYKTLQLKVTDGKNDISNVVWGIENAGYDATAGISSSGLLQGVKAGTVTVAATLADSNITLKKVITILPKNVVSFAFGGIATASSQADTARNPSKALDEDPLTMWRCGDNSGNFWYQLDLGKTISPTGMKILWYEGNQPKTYDISFSQDGSTWEKIRSVTSPGTGSSDYSDIQIFDQTKPARYIRIQATGSSTYTPGIIEFQVLADPQSNTPVNSIDVTSATGSFAITGKGVSLQLNAAVTPTDATDKRIEWTVTNPDGSVTTIADILPTGMLTPLRDGQVLVTAKSVDGSAVSKSTLVDISNQTLINVALNKSASATTNGGSSNLPAAAVDGNKSTRWGSKNGAPQVQYFAVDLLDTYTISTVSLYCDSGAYPVDFKLQYSNDNTNWTDIENVTANANPNRTFVFSPVDARYVRTLSSKTTNSSWGYSIWEFEVYGVSKAALTPPTDLTVTTDAGTAPVLPAKVDCKNGSGATVSADVTWKAISALKYAVAGTFTAQGNLTDGTAVYIVVNVKPAVYFDLNGVAGQAPDKKVMTLGQMVGTLPAPQLDGHDFICWNTQADGKGVTYTDSTIYDSHISTMLYAIWKAEPSTPVKPVLVLDALDKTKILVNNYADSYADRAAVYGELQYQITTGESAGAWTNYDNSTGILGNPVTEYSIKLRYAGNLNYKPGSQSLPATITTGKFNQYSPAQPTIIGQTENITSVHIAVLPVENGEYAVVPKDAVPQSGDWKTSNEFTDLTPGASYDVYIRYKETDTVYASSESPKLAITAIKLTQAPPAIGYTREGDWQTEGVTVTIISPVTGATYSTDNYATTVANPISFPAGTTSAAIYVRLDETPTHKQSAAAKVEIDFTKQNQAAPSVTLDAVSDQNKITLTINANGGKTGSYEYRMNNESLYINVPADGKIICVTPGKLINLFVRDKGDSNYNPSADATAAATLPKYKNNATVAITEANFNVIDTSIKMISLPEATSGSAIEYSFDGGVYVILDAGSLPGFTGLEPGSSHTISVRVAGDDEREAGTATSITIVTTSSKSGSSDIITVISPDGVQISGTNISANVSNGTSSLAINLNVSEKAAWKLYSDSACTTEIPDKTMNLSVGANTAYIKVIAEDGTEKVYTITLTRASASITGGGVSSTSGNTSTISDVSGATVTPQAAISDGSTIAKPSDASLRKALENAQNIAKTTGKPVEVVIAVSAKTNTDTVAVTIPKTAFEEVGNGSEAALTLKTGDISLTFSNPAIDTINKDAKGDIEFTAGKADVTKLTDEQKINVADRPVYSFSVSSSGKAHTEFKGNVTVSIPYTLKPGENPNAVIIYYVDNKGNLQVVENGIYDTASGKITFSTRHFSVYMIGYNPVSFKDVKTHWGKTAIDFAAARDLVKGVGNGLYQPDREVTRAEFIQMVQSVLKLPNTDDTAGYSDVVPGKWYYNAIMSLKAAGLLEGIELYGNSFKPNQAITREEMAVILANTAVYKKLNVPSGDLDLSAKFKDYKSINSDYRDETQSVVKLGLMNGVGGENFDPKGVTTRAQAAQIQMNLLKLQNGY